MFTQAIIKRSGAIVSLMLLLAACGGAGNGDFVIDWTVDWPWPDQGDVIVNKAYASQWQLDGQLRVYIDARNGHVAIKGLPDADSVFVEADLLVASNTFADAMAGLDQLEVSVNAEPDEIVVRTSQPERAWGRQYVVNYTITVPADLEAQVQQINGSVRVEDVTGSVFVSTTSGSIYGELMPAPGKDIEMSTVNGGLTMLIAKSTSARLSASVGNGLIQWSNLPLSNVIETARSLRGTLGKGEGRLVLETVNGSIGLSGAELKQVAVGPNQ